MFIVVYVRICAFIQRIRSLLLHPRVTSRSEVKDHETRLDYVTNITKLIYLSRLYTI
jgi:hypothetical protein